MFDIGWSELVLIGIVALIVIGPKELPTALRTAGLWMGKVRRMAGEFQGQFQEAMREAEMAELKKQVDEIGNSTSNLGNFDPIGSIKNDIEGVFDDKPKPAVRSAETSGTIAGATAPAVSPAQPAAVLSEIPPINAPPAGLPEPQIPPNDMVPAPAGDALPPKVAGERP
jgi:sec-independent protein translocase protein TatB